MKKKLMIGAALCASMIFGGLTSMAQDNAKCDKAAACTRTCDKPADCNKPCPFEGLNLTDAQKTQLEQLCQEQQKARQEKKQAKADNKQKKAEGRKAARRENLAKIKAILTPEQYVTYLENVAVQGKSFKAQKGQKAGKGQGMRQGQKGQRPQRPAQCPQGGQCPQQAPAQQN